MKERPKLTQEYLKSILHYDPDTGFFTWLRALGSTRIGKRAGSFEVSRTKRYIRLQIDGARYHAHRLAFLYMEGSLPENCVDHISGDGTANKWVNLRRATRQENQRNMRLSVRNTSGHSGVGWDKVNNKWSCLISVGGKNIRIGRFADIRDAIAARKAANIKYGFHPNHGQSRPL